MSKQSKPPIDPGAITRRQSKHGLVYRVPSRSTADHSYDVLRETTGRLRCPCAAGVHDRPCCHKDAVEALEAIEAEEETAARRAFDAEYAAFAGASRWALVATRDGITWRQTTGDTPILRARLAAIDALLAAVAQREQDAAA